MQLFLFLKNCKRKEHTVYVVSSLTSFLYLSAFLQWPLCKSPSVEAVAKHKCWLLEVCVTPLFLYLCILIAWTRVQWSFFFLWTAVFEPGFLFFRLFHKHPPLYEHSQRASYVNPAKGCAAVLQRDEREKKKSIKRRISNALLKSCFFVCGSCIFPLHSKHIWCFCSPLHLFWPSTSVSKPNNCALGNAAPSTMEVSQGLGDILSYLPL